LQRDFSLHDRFAFDVGNVEPEVLTETQHVGIVLQDVATDAANLFFATNVKQALEQLAAQALSLERVGNHNGKLGGVGALEPAKATDRDDLVVAGFRVAVDGYERHFAVVVDED